MLNQKVYDMECDKENGMVNDKWYIFDKRHIPNIQHKFDILYK